MHLSTLLKLVVTLWGIAFLLAFGVLIMAIRKPASPDEKKSPYAIARTVAAREIAAKEDGGGAEQAVATTRHESSRQKAASDYKEG